jgi:hypothetical protein
MTIADLAHFAELLIVTLMGGGAFCLLFATSAYCLASFFEMNERWKQTRRNLELQRLILAEELYQTRQRANRRQRR